MINLRKMHALSFFLFLQKNMNANNKMNAKSRKKKSRKPRNLIHLGVKPNREKGRHSKHKRKEVHRKNAFHEPIHESSIGSSLYSTIQNSFSYTKDKIMSMINYITTTLLVILSSRETYESIPYNEFESIWSNYCYLIFMLGTSTYMPNLNPIVFLLTSTSGTILLNAMVDYIYNKQSHQMDTADSVTRTIINTDLFAINKTINNFIHGYVGSFLPLPKMAVSIPLNMIVNKIITLAIDRLGSSAITKSKKLNRTDIKTLISLLSERIHVL